MKRQTHRRRCSINVGDFIYLKGKYVTAKWEAISFTETGVLMKSVSAVRKEYIHPEQFFYPGKSLWKGGLPAFPENKTLERDHQAFVLKNEAMSMIKALLKIQRRLAKMQSAEKIVSCTNTMSKAISELKLNLRKK
jgi:hypothetical protein